MSSTTLTSPRAGDRDLCVLVLLTAAALAALPARPAAACDTFQFTQLQGTLGPAASTVHGGYSQSRLISSQTLFHEATSADNGPSITVTGHAADMGVHQLISVAVSATNWVLEPDAGYAQSDLATLRFGRMTANLEGLLQAETSGTNTASLTAGGNMICNSAADDAELNWSLSGQNMSYDFDLPDGAPSGNVFGFAPSDEPNDRISWEDFGRTLDMSVALDPQLLPGTDLVDPRSCKLSASSNLNLVCFLLHTDPSGPARAFGRIGLNYGLDALDNAGQPRDDVTAYLVIPPAPIATLEATELAPDAVRLIATIDDAAHPDYWIPTRGESLVWFYRDADFDGIPTDDELIGVDNWGGDGWSLVFARDPETPYHTGKYLAVAENACGVQGEIKATLIDHAPETRRNTGQTIANVGDLDGDGFHDYAVSSPKYFQGRGRVAVYSGQLLQPLYTRVGRNMEDNYGTAVTSIADLDGDGIRDLLIGAPREDLAGLSDCGSVEIVSGADGSRIAIRRGAFAFERFGWAIDAGQDLDGDGAEDFIVGAPGASRGANGNTGAVYLHSGADLSRIRRILGRDAWNYLGWSVALLPDFDGDGFADFAAGAPFNSDRGPAAGRFTVWSGQSGLPLFHRRGAIDEDFAGYALATTGDLDGDGLGDLVVGTPGYDTAAGANVGKITAWNHLGQPIWSRGGQHVNGYMGLSLERLDDLNCDGIDDIAAGASGANVVQVFSGQDKSLLSELTPPDDATGDYGAALAWLPGTLADDAGLLLVGAPTGGPLGHGTVELEFLGTCATTNLPGDLDADGIVDGNDYLLVLLDLGCTGTGCIGDLNGDGVTDNHDVELMEQYLGL